MQPQLAFLHRDTPSMTVVESRGLAVRSVDYYRAAQGEVAEARVNRTVHDPAGRAIAQWDPRLFLETSAPANLSSTLSLSDMALSTVSVDAGLSVNLFGEADQPVQSWDGRGSQRWMHYDDQLRLTALFEQAARGEAVCAERLTYATNDPAFAVRNQCGRLIRHDDRAGTQLFPTFGLTGGLLEQTRHFLRTLEIPDWPVPVDERDTWLEPGSGATTRSRFNPLGEAVEQTDAQGNRQLFSHTVTGQLREVRLQLRGDTTPKTLVSAIQYNAHGQTEREVAGNGVITTLEYAAQEARLTRLHARRGNDVLQDAHYEYDPTGNVQRIEDTAVPICYFANQRIDPVYRFFYDSLNHLIRATGWEGGGANRGPQFSAFDDPAPRGNYCQSYHYDRGGNLLELIHEGPQNHGHRLVAAPFSNRCLPVIDGVEPGEEDFRRGFDANGNLQCLQPGQTLSWDLRNQLCEVRPVERDGAQNDSERYIYGADGMRVRKVRSTQTNARTVLVEVRYLPGLEVRTHSGTGEVLHVINVQAGRSSVRVLHWETAPPKDSANDEYRFCLNDHLGSCTLELDSDGEVISQERYHPFGTTAWFAGRGEVEASRKTVRYSGKERDATGLYYYGFRYYVAWLQRWLSPDPAKDIESLNLYAFVSNSPVTRYDKEGLVSWPWSRSTQSISSSVDMVVEIFNRDKEGRLRVMLDAERDKYGDVLVHLAGFDNDTSALDEYVEGGNGVYAQINNELRSGQTAGDPELSSLIKELKQEVENLPEYEGEVYRATRTPPGVYGKLIKQGDAVMDMAYMSTSAIPHHAIDWLETWVDENNNNEKNERVLFVFDKSTTKKVASAGMLTDHVLIKPNTVFKVKDVRHVESAQYGNVTVVGLKPANDPSVKDIKDIFSGDVLLPATNASVTNGLRSVFSRWLKK
ncbi:insecticidal toxin complex protein TccC [Pseudomonas migulae]|uniref:RHS repeat domain-containing protein n=1 Tax=Pseudomonas migulae TaxID=78543 RepID=UPI00209DE8CE|nr:RHS repeat-associated core domain-containing protein [Pseudomonas migulae]MCP1516491.1 insecticidal toxin complex protein TccC [Pseudomonas migulae]